ncbi:MAG: glycosyltransferase [Dysgonamonadaceae bacterium]|jgi:glycosyltransferase involved in cell wall biosynthesis|nr:glycosyltransferase [Dysgonamonadaceae bacterium]
MDLVTLAIPVYNAEKYIERALLSALDQTYPNMEYLIVDDRGNDNSVKIISEIMSTHPRGKNVRIIEHSQNLGIGAGRNTAIEKAKGKYLCYMDNDDELTLDCVQKLYDEMIKTDADVVGGSYKIVSENTTLSEMQEEIKLTGNEKIIGSYFNGIFNFPTWNKLYKLDFLRKNNICSIHRTIDDVYFSFLVALNAQSFSRIKDITYLHHTRNDSASGGTGTVWKEIVFREYIQIFKDMSDYLRQSSLNPALKLNVKKKLFKRRYGIAKMAWKSPYHVRDCIKEYLSPTFLKDSDIFRSGFLFLGYVYSMMPLPEKKMIIQCIIGKS